MAIDNFELIALFDNINKLKEFLLSFGLWGGILFAFAFTVLRPLGFPNVLLALLAVSTWPFHLAFFFSWLGQLGAQLVNFAFARYVAHDFIRQRLSPRLLELDDEIKRNSFRLTLIGQFLFSRSRTVGWFFGLSKVSISTFFGASALGVIPWVIIYLYFIEYFIKLYNEGITLEQLIVALTVVFALIVLVYRWRHSFKALLFNSTVKKSP